MLPIDVALELRSQIGDFRIRLLEDVHCVIKFVLDTGNLVVRLTFIVDGLADHVDFSGIEQAADIQLAVQAQDLIQHSDHVIDGQVDSDQTQDKIENELFEIEALRRPFDQVFLQSHIGRQVLQLLSDLIDFCPVLERAYGQSQ